MTKQVKNTVQVILPLAIPRSYTYNVPDDLKEKIRFGMRVEVPIKNKLYSGIVCTEVVGKIPETRLRSIVSILDDYPIIDNKQFEFWKWIADYYCCTIGEVMTVALPGGLKLYSETKIVPVVEAEETPIEELSDDEYMVLEAIQMQGELSIDNIRDILNKKSIYPVIHTLIDKNKIVIKEELIEKFKPKKESIIYFPPDKAEDEEWLAEVFDKVDKSENQRRALLAYIQHRGKNEKVSKKLVRDTAHVTSSVIKAMAKKGIFIEEKQIVSRVNPKELDVEKASQLSSLQIEKLAEIKTLFDSQNTVLLHGVTGSGKTRIFTELMEDVIKNGGQVLYLLPEIALTTQIVERLKYVFGDKVLVYHSKLNSHERVELYKESRKEGKIILGARSAIFMPFSNLELIVVDEEHDSSYKQQDPAPRYNARDLAIVLGHMHDAKILLGTATPSLESWLNAKSGKYGYVALLKRFGESLLPDIELVDLKRAYQTKKMKSYFSQHLLESIQDTIVMGRQVILFQNRRGFAPVLNCEMCGWKAECKNCDTSMTVHKYFDELRCHYCGFRKHLYKVCPACGNEHLMQSGFGTEKIEEELSKLLPDARIARMDYDTTKTKSAYERIIYEFSTHKLDILIGTQMVTKGLDFDKVSLVSILNADKLLMFPDFRAHERAFQLMIQVSGRAGRRKTKGKVIIQTFSPTHHIFTDVINSDFERFYEEEEKERLLRVFPPAVRAIELTLKHKKLDRVKEAGMIYRDLLKEKIGERVSALFEPSIPRLRGYYIRQIFIKTEKDHKTNMLVKKWVRYYRAQILNSDGFKSLRINIDVDPY